MSKNNAINKKLLTFLIGAGLQISNAEARTIDVDRNSTFSVNSIESVSKMIDPSCNGCCGGSTCNGSC